MAQKKKLQQRKHRVICALDEVEDNYLSPLHLFLWIFNIKVNTDHESFQANQICHL